MIKFADILPSVAALAWKKRRLNKGIFFPSTGCFKFSRLNSLELEMIAKQYIGLYVLLKDNLPFLSLD